jgi:hypothetical protein
MNRNVQVVLVTLCIFLIVTIASGSCTRGTPTPEQKVYYLIGNLEAANATILTDEGQERATTLSGEIRFRVVSESTGDLTMSLDCLNLVGEGVPTAEGDSGVIGLDLAAPDNETNYDASTGRVTTEFSSNLHYDLIDQIKGYRRLESEGEQDLFLPYTEEMVGNLTGGFPKNLQPAENGTTTFTGEVECYYRSTVVGALQHVNFSVIIGLTWLTTWAESIRIQPVFIGTGPTDPTHTGTAFDTLMTRAQELWNKCGSVRCVKFTVLQPIYINNPAYEVLDDAAEVDNLRAEVNVTTAVEIFVAGSIAEDLTCLWGGGATWGSGTASAKIVTSDQQLSVPCPCPVACQGFCPCGGCGVNNSTCGAVNYYHLAHELGHVLNLCHPGDYTCSMNSSTVGSIMEPSGFCCDNPNVQSAMNCRNAANPLMYWAYWSGGACSGSPDIMD